MICEAVPRSFFRGASRRYRAALLLCGALAAGVVFTRTTASFAVSPASMPPRSDNAMPTCRKPSAVAVATSESVRLGQQMANAVVQ